MDVYPRRQYQRTGAAAFLVPLLDALRHNLCKVNKICKHPMAHAEFPAASSL
jgi:hypothetical protein